MLALYSWNVNGIRAVVKKGTFMPFIETHKPDILCLQETKAAQHESPLDLPQYHEYWNSASKKGYSGTAIFSKIKPRAVRNGFPDEIQSKYAFADAYGDPTTEGRVVTAEFETFHVVTVYTPNAKDDLSRLRLRHTVWDKAFLEYCKYLTKKKPVIVCGDFNVAHRPDDLARPDENEGEHGYTKEEREGFQALLDAGFVDTFRIFTKGNGHYTWWTNWGAARARNIGWRIDYFLVSEELKEKVKKADIHANIMGSDHCPVSVHIDA
jgi:exodeoxyribonuclease-3